uniref:Uncharacterized protein n=1 Tax=Romanomermis culicivorax TaxID=13658 RepID=A0A915HQJ6_ROMCU
MDVNLSNSDFRRHFSSCQLAIKSLKSIDILDFWSTIFDLSIFSNLDFKKSIPKFSARHLANSSFKRSTPFCKMDISSPLRRLEISSNDSRNFRLKNCSFFRGTFFSFSRSLASDNWDFNSFNDLFKIQISRPLFTLLIFCFRRRKIDFKFSCLNLLDKLIFRRKFSLFLKPEILGICESSIGFNSSKSIFSSFEIKISSSNFALTKLWSFFSSEISFLYVRFLTIANFFRNVDNLTPQNPTKVGV